MELAFLNHKIDDEEINIVIHHNVITGIINDTSKKIYNLVNLKKIGKGPVIINGQKLSKDDLFMSQKRISIVDDRISFPNFINNVEDLMNYNIRAFNLIIKDSDKKMKDSLRIVGLNSNYLERNIYTLSNSEKKLILIAISLLANPDTIIIEEPYKYLDLKQEKRLNMLFRKLVDQYGKTIVLKSDDKDRLYLYTDEIIIVRNEQVLLSGDTKDIYQRVDYLKRNGIAIPEIVKFTYTANKQKDAKLEYHNDIRDIIKDIYKHV